MPIHQGNGVVLAETGGVPDVTLTLQQIPQHSHSFVGSTDIASLQSPSNAVVAQSTVAQLYIQDTADQALAANSILPTGGNQPHENMQPFLCVDFIISLFGIYPSQT